jgi:hypothetical protein
LLAVFTIIDAANSGSIGPWEVWNGVLNLVVAVGQGNKHVSSSEGIEVIHDILLSNGVVIRRSGVSGSVDSSGHLVDVRVGVHVLPEGLSILRVVTTGVSLLGTVVVEWDSSTS